MAAWEACCSSSCCVDCFHSAATMARHRILPCERGVKWGGVGWGGVDWRQAQQQQRYRAFNFLHQSHSSKREPLFISRAFHSGSRGVMSVLERVERDPLISTCHRQHHPRVDRVWCGPPERSWRGSIQSPVLCHLLL